MTPAEVIFETLAGWQPAGPGPHATRVALDGPVEALTLTAARADGLSCLLDELSVAYRDAGEVTAESLTRLAVAAAERVTGLAEPLKVYEVDARQGRALLRSATPAERG